MKQTHDVVSRYVKKCLPAMAVFLTAAIAHGNGPNVDDASAEQASTHWIQELILSSTPVPQEKGEIQLTVIGSHFEFPGNGRTNGAGLEIEYGLTDRLQISAELPYQWRKEYGEAQVDGLADVELGVLHKLIATDMFLLSASFAVALPTGDAESGLGGGSVIYEPGLSAAFATGGWQLFARAAAELGSGDDALSYGAAVARPIGDWAPMLELAGEISRDEADPSPGDRGAIGSFCSASRSVLPTTPRTLELWSK